MSKPLKLQDVDVDGAVRETAAAAMDALDGDTRAAFLKRAGLAGGALAGSGVLLGAFASEASAFTTGDRPPVKPFGKGDVGILNYALVLEYLESSFYNGATENQRRNAFIPNNQPQAHVFLRTVTRDENEHVALLKKVLGRQAIKKPRFDFRGDNASFKPFLTAAFGFENTGVHAYSGQAFNIRSPQYLAAALSIVTVEARHAAAVGLIRNESEYGITPSGAFDTPQGATKVLQEVESLHYITQL
jgi:rubrerythrin